MAWGSIVGGLLGAGGQVAGGLLGGASGGDARTNSYNPALDYALQASQFDALNSIGFGNIDNLPGPYEQLVGKIASLSMPSKTRAQVMSALNNIRANPSDLDDPFGKNFTLEQKRAAIENGAPSGRIIENKKKINIDKLNNSVSKMPIDNISALNRVLKGMGIKLADLKDTFAKEAEHVAQMQRFKDAGLGQLNEKTIINRARANATANEMIGGAADFARTGTAGPGIGTDLFNRDERQLKDIQDRLGIMANFGGLNPATMFEQLTDAKLDQNLRLIEQQLGMSNALNAALNPGLTAATGAGNTASSVGMNAVQIAAAQAQAAAQLRAQAAQTGSSSLANGIAGGLGSLGSAIGNYSLMQQIGSLQRQNPTGSGFSSGLSPASGNGISAFANGTGQLAPIGGW